MLVLPLHQALKADMMPTPKGTHKSWTPTLIQLTQIHPLAALFYSLNSLIFWTRGNEELLVGTYASILYFERYVYVFAQEAKLWFRCVSFLSITMMLTLTMMTRFRSNSREVGWCSFRCSKGSFMLQGAMNVWETMYNSDFVQLLPQGEVFAWLTCYVKQLF